MLLMSAGVHQMVYKLSQLCLQGKVVFACSVTCSQEFKKAHCVTSLCENCKIEKITTDAKRINNKDCFFCSDGKETLQYILHFQPGFYVFWEVGAKKCVNLKLL